MYTVHGHNTCASIVRDACSSRTATAVPAAATAAATLRAVQILVPWQHLLAGLASAAPVVTG